MASLRCDPVANGFLAREDRYRRLFEDARDIVFTTDLAGRLSSVNKAAQRLTGYSRDELLAMKLAELAVPECRHVIREVTQACLGGECVSEFELPIVTRDGSRAVLEISARLWFEIGKPCGLQGIGRDVTERKRLEEQLRQKQKMEAIGQLAGGIAHDFNNLLSAILGYADLLKLHAAPGELAREAADIIQIAGERAHELTNRLLGFARLGRSQNVPVDLHTIVREVIGLLRRTFPKNVETHEWLAAPQSCILGDPVQMHQLFLNLALNARDAMPEGGALTFATEDVDLDEATAAALSAPSAGPHVRISVIDTGIGILPEHLPRLFEPFFTTKDRDKGSGMGLATVYGIVKNHGGAIEVRSEPGQGAIFHIYLPSRPDLEPTASPGPVAGLPTGSGRILVIDDEDVVCRTSVRMLESLGYDAIAVADPREAIDLYRKAGSAFDLVILDELDCLLALRRINPGIRAVLTSGQAQEATGAGAVAILPKPYQLRALAETVAEALRGVAR